MLTATATVTDEKTPILIVDDSRTVRAGLSKVLSPKFSIIEAEDGEDGWNKLQGNGSIKLVITDIMMPQLDGYGLICRIRGADQEQLQNLPIIVVTSAEDELSRERAHACGANNFIVKPAKPSDLIERVNFHTEEHLNGEPLTAPQMADYESEIESAVIETPDLDTALDMLKSGEMGSIAPYAVDLALDVMPLLEYCNKEFEINVEEHILALKEKLQSI
jgi:CheY-like chemotaxis protein